jgi:outer membrane cobalamin receptor
MDKTVIKRISVIVFFILNVSQVIFSQTSNDSASLRRAALSSADTTRKNSDTLYLGIQEFQRRSDSLSATLFADSSFFYKVIAHDELMKYYHEDFADFLWHAGGFYVHDLGSYGKPITASINGLSNQQILILYDGVPMNDPDAGWMNLNALPLENMERIEIFRGNASAQYGAAAAGGYINIVPRVIAENKPLTSIKFRSAFSPFQDVGVYFGRNFGRRLQIAIGGSKKGTPGEQNLQGLEAGFLTAQQATRYSGRTLFGQINYLINRQWSANFYTQNSRDRFDAYGRNIYGDLNAYKFATKGGLRKDDRTDYHFGVTRGSQNSLFQSHLYFTQIDRTSAIADITIPRFYTTKAIGFDAHYGISIFSHALSAGGSYRRQSVDSLKTPHSQFVETAVYVSDKFNLGKVLVQPSLRLENHSVYHQTTSANVNASLPVTPKMNWFINVGYAQAYPSLVDVFQRNVNFDPQTTSPAPHDYLFASDSLNALRKEKITSFSSTMKLTHIFHIDQITVSAYGNRLRDAIYYYPIHFNTDSMKIKADNLSRAKTYGVEFEAVKKISVFQFTARQSLSKGNDEIRSGVPAYRTYLSGTSELFFFKRNLKLIGFLSAMYFHAHSGFTFQDAPQIYFVTPRRAGGGWILNARVSAIVGDLTIFYEVENFLRARFTILDGYDVTRQQYRFGLLWKLFN